VLEALRWLAPRLAPGVMLASLRPTAAAREARLGRTDQR